MARGNGQPSRKSAASAFNATTSNAQKQLATHPSGRRTLGNIEARALRLRERAIEHHKAFEDRWTAAEAMRIWKRHLEENKKHAAPPGVRRDVVPEAVMKMAAQNVRARTVRRLSLIKSIKVRMSNTIARNSDQPRLRQEFAEAAPSEGMRRATPKMRRTQ